MTSSSIPSNTNNASSTTTHKHTNALINEQSPYLLQHAHNPVNWYPWSEESINKAKQENKPIFLSVGYSTCHWCHVMEHESFEDETVAKILNNSFICIKVDREERPDVDRMYMNYVTAITQRGGWPMSVWLTPTLQPFFGGTYFPKNASQNGIGFIQLLEKIINLWSTDQERVIQQSHETMQMLEKAFSKTNKDIIELLPKESKTEAEYKSNELHAELQLAKHFQVLHNKYDKKLFGFGKAPKFPRPSEIQLLLRYYYRYQNTAEGKLALDMCMNTLQAMGNGGINDHIGGGFHRYSVDEYWHVPHFEKMLYDNAQLANVYLDVYSITKDVYYRTIAEEILQYIMRDMTFEGGGIYSAEDADSIETHINPKSVLKKEGAFYIWSESELKEILTDDEFFIVQHLFTIEKKGNCSLSPRSDPHREFAGLNVLIKRCSIIDILQKINKLSKRKSLDICSIKEIEVCLESAKMKMFEYRNSTRIRPHLDNKIICSWNGLMLHAFSKAHNVLKLGCNAVDDRYLNAAKNIADFIYDNMRNGSNGHLYRIYGKTSIDGFATDYAFLIYGLLELYEASFDAKYLKWSMELQDIQIELFFDRELGGFYDSMTDDKYILMRIKEEYDGAEPCSTTVSINNLLKLHAIIGKEDYKYVYAKNCLQFIARTMTSMAMAMPLGCIALDSYENGLKHIVLSAVSHTTVNSNEIIDEEKDNVQKENIMNSFLNVLHGNFYDDSVCVVLNDKNIQEMAAINEHYGHFGGDNESQVLAHVCQSFVCQKPAKTSAEFEYILNNN